MSKSEVIEQAHRDEAKALAVQAREDMEAAAEAEEKIVRTASFIALDAYKGSATYRFSVRKIAALGLVPSRLEVEAEEHAAAARRCTGVEFGHVRDRNQHGQAARALREAAQLIRYREEYARLQAEYAAITGADASYARFRAACLDLAQGGRTRRDMTPEAWVSAARRAIEIARAMR
jgi:hypothetical protein